MNPLLIAIIASAVVVLYPSIKGALAKLNQTDADRPPPVVLNPQRPTTAGKPSCINNLLAMAKCLPEGQRDAFIKKYAAEMLMKEIE